MKAVGADFEKEVETGEALYQTMGQQDKPILSNLVHLPDWRVCHRVKRAAVAY